MKKKVIGAVAVALAGVVTAGTILSHVSETAYAQESFVGIDSIIEEHGEENPFTIVEIVPDYSLAKLGYFVEGSEPFYYNADTGSFQTWLEHLKELSTAEERRAYMSGLETTLASLSTRFDSMEELLAAQNVTTALSYVPYTEFYAAFAGAESFTLTKPLEMKAGTAGYEMVKTDDGKGGFTLELSYRLAEQDEEGTRYAQKVSYYTMNPENANENYYILTFVCEENPKVGAEAYVVENAQEVETDKLTSWDDIYYVGESGAYVKADGIKDDVDKYYRVTFKHTLVEEQPEPAKTEETGGGDTNSGTGDAGTTDGTGNAGTTDGTGDAGTTGGAGDADNNSGNGQTNPTDGTDANSGSGSTDPADDTTTTTTATPAAVSPDPANASDAAADSTTVYYYQVDTDKVGFDATGGSMYGAVPDAETPYVEDEKGQFVCDKAYTQVADGQGDYTIVEGETKKLDGMVHIEQVYYTGNYVNNELFKQSVFNQSGLLDGEGASDIAIRLLTFTPEDYMNYGGEMDLLYLSNSSSLAGSGSSKRYGSGNDLSDIYVDMIQQDVISDSVRLPVIVDYSIMSDKSLKGTGVQKLAKLLTAKTMESGNLSRKVDTDGNITITVYDVAEYPDDDHFYVHDNVLVVPADSGSFSLMKDFDSLFLDDTGKADTQFQEDADAIGFGDIASTIITENTYRAVENEAVGSNTYGLYNQTISKAIATEYIISFVERRAEYVNEDLRILDVEPCTINATTQTQIEENIKKMLNYDESSSQTIEFVHMSSAEFISKVEDLCEYDMLYFGLYTDTMNTKNGRTVYNDSSMDGLVYTNVGDIRYDQYSLGVLDTEYANISNHYTVFNSSASTTMRSFSWGDSTDRDFVRYSGNDLTSEKVTAVENFLKSGSPVVLADNFLTTGADGKVYAYDFQYDKNGKQITSKNGYIDNCSRMFELIDAIKDQSNVLTESTVLGSDAKKKTLIRYISLGKPKLTIDAGAQVSGQEYYNTTGSKVTFNFSIENFGSADADATFYCSLYADYNADGRYAAAENVAANDFKITLNGVTQAAQVMTDDDGNDIYYYELSPTDSTTSYRLSYDISDSYVGVLPIKLKVSQSTNSYRYDSEQLYFYKSRSEKQNKVSIKVLQILSNAGSSCNIGESGVYDGTLSTTNSEFYRQLNSEAMKDYDMTIHAMTVTRYLNMYRADPDFLDEYDMLIIGFMDCYVWNMSDAERVEAYQGVSDFIATGKSVLFTHDTTSYNNNPAHARSGWAGKALNQLIAPEVGFDRYGVYSNNILRAGIKNLTSTSTTKYKVSDYYSLKLAKEEGILTKDTYTGAELFNLIVDNATANNKDIAYKPNSNKTALVTEVHGQSSMTINGNSSGTYYNTNASSLGGTPTTTTAELINEGQILVYPFNIMDDMRNNNNIIKVATTHAQYFQIDMNEDLDNDGESDVTVWLSLTGNNSEYNAAKRDARNNYYIYTKGNVTYSGVGHSAIDYSSNVTEVQLYINTMVTAYSAGARSPSISLKQSSDANSADLSTIYVGMDSKVDALTGAVDDGEQIDAGTERIYYTISDTNVTQGGVKKISVQYYLVYASKDDAPLEYQSVGEYLTIDETTVFAVEQHWDTYKGSRTTKETSLDNITTGVSYACDIPYDVLKADEDETTIWVVATTNIWKQGANTTKKPSGSYPAYDYIKVQRIGLFDLD